MQQQREGQAGQAQRRLGVEFHGAAGEGQRAVPGHLGAVRRTPAVGHDPLHRERLPGVRQGVIRRRGDRAVEHVQRDEGVGFRAALMMFLAEQAQLAHRQFGLRLLAGPAEIFPVDQPHEGGRQGLDEAFRQLRRTAARPVEVLGPEGGARGGVLEPDGDAEVPAGASHLTANSIRPGGFTVRRGEDAHAFEVGQFGEQVGGQQRHESRHRTVADTTERFQDQQRSAPGGGARRRGRRWRGLSVRTSAVRT